MGRRRRSGSRGRKRKRGRGLPYVYKDRIYFGQKPQSGKGVVSKILANLLKNAGDITGI